MKIGRSRLGSTRCAASGCRFAVLLGVTLPNGHLLWGAAEGGHRDKETSHPGDGRSTGGKERENTHKASKLSTWPSTWPLPLARLLTKSHSKAQHAEVSVQSTRNETTDAEEGRKAVTLVTEASD